MLKRISCVIQLWLKPFSYVEIISILVNRQIISNSFKDEIVNKIRENKWVMLNYYLYNNNWKHLKRKEAEGTPQKQLPMPTTPMI